MLPSLRAFLTGIIDYAGLFPPAQLQLDQAIRKHARYRTEPESWMLGRFVCPMERLSELAADHEELFQQEGVFAFSAVWRAEEIDPVQYKMQWEKPYKAMLEFCYRHGRRVRIDAVEVRLAPTLLADSGLSGFMDVCSELIDFTTGKQSLPLVTVFFEHDPQADWQASANGLIAHLRQNPLRRQGYKLRCGGLHASTFPSVDQVAHVIAACRDAGVPLKFTAGLHHPLRHYDAGVQTHMHGFLNVFGAGVLAHARRIGEEQVCAILADEDASHFVFEEDGFRWNDLRAGVDEIATARQEAVISFGSCSFDEPREDLRRLGLL